MRIPEDYKLKEHISTSDLPYIKRSPKHFLMNCMEKTPSTLAQIEGNAVHTAILEPDLFDKRYYVLDDAKIVSEIGGGNPRATKVYKEWKAEFIKKVEGKEALSLAQMDMINTMKKNVMDDDFLRELISDIDFEVKVDWECRFTGQKCHTRLDGVSKSRNVIVELKTTTNASTPKIIQEIRKFMYHHKAWFQKEGFEQGLGRGKLDHYLFIFIEKQAPFYGVNTVRLGEETMKSAGVEVVDLLDEIKKCKEKDYFYGYEGEIAENNELGITPIEIFKTW